MSGGSHGSGPFGSIPFGSGSSDVTDRGGISLFRKRATETQLRIQPENATPSDPVGDVGRITVVAGANLVTGDRFELRDLVNPTIKFVFDVGGGSVTETQVTRVIEIDGTETAEQIRDLCLVAIDDAPLLDMVATAVGTDQIQVDQPAPGPDGKGTIVEVVADPGFLVDLSPPDGSHVVCLGSDLLMPPVEDYKIGDFVNIYQSITLEVATKLVRIQSRFRQPESLPIREALPAGTEVEHVDRAGASNLGLLKTTSPFFDATQHVLRSVYLTGAGIADGVYRIFEVRDPMNAVLDGLPNPAVSTSEAVTGYVRGAHWELNVYFENTVMFTFDPGSDGGRDRDLLLPDLTINVSKFSGVRQIKYELRLAETP